MNITVLGAGSIGSLWAYKLAKAGHKVSVWTRQPREKVIFVKLDNKAELQLTANNSELLAQSDLILITVKAWQVKQAILPLLDKIHSDTILLFMHNGMGAVEEIDCEVQSHPTVLATTTHGAFKPEPDTVLHTGAGSTQLGAYNNTGQQCHFLAEILHHALPEATWSRDINQALWNKLAVNCAINPLTAIHQVRNGELNNKKYLPSLRKITCEVSSVMQAEGVTMSAESLFENVLSVIKATARNQSSMQQDIYYKRRSEIDYINGYLCRAAQRHSIDVPENLKLYRQIKQIEQGWKIYE